MKAYDDFIKQYGIYKDNRAFKSAVKQLLISYSEYLWIEKNLPMDIIEYIEEFIKEE